MPIPTPPLTLGIEEEYQIINPKTHNLYAYISHLLSQDEEEPERINIKPEFMQSQVEVGSHICQNVQEIRGELVRLRRQVVQMAERNGLAIAAASTHPFGRWEEQSITEGVRYRELLDDMQGLARQLLIFGMHVHVGFGHENNPELKNLMIEIMNQSRYFIPHLLALSTSSPFWHGTNTGLKSYRSVIFEMLPRTGIPHSFDSWAEYVGFTKTMDAVGAFGKRDKVAKIWWDIRPHPVFDTMEFRIADICTSLDDAVCLAGLFQAICAKLIKLRRHNMAWRHYRHMHISENKWRAVRFGINGELIDFGREESVPFPVLAEELLEFVDDVLDELGSRQEVEHVRTILERGTSADRQIATYEANGGDDNREAALNAVVDFLIAETKAGLS
ncbi:MAG: carboxylate-amine ligase [Anaerolineales bacterium]|nr:carboxylate-amine ligase [Anaerolineales bacterium]MCB0018195.1 carboxylate-amine ligase [Anaerolineales bacterium]MCB0026395.1 carboxylate-amine ligase [Anaerolineales bacterium]MCB8958936.1 carboxylate-amine ligase [Ardenticatenales bacterium]